MKKSTLILLISTFVLAITMLFGFRTSANSGSSTIARGDGFILSKVVDGGITIYIAKSTSTGNVSISSR